MRKEEIKALLEELSQDSGETQAALRELLEERYGSEQVPLVLRMLDQRPDMLLPQTMRVLGRAKVLDARTAELIALASAAALRCEFCLKAHIGQAQKQGATDDEIFEAILIASMIAESSTQAVAFRVFQQSTHGRRRSPARHRSIHAGSHPPQAGRA